MFTYKKCPATRTPTVKNIRPNVVGLLRRTKNAQPPPIAGNRVVPGNFSISDYKGIVFRAPWFVVAWRPRVVTGGILIGHGSPVGGDARRRLLRDVHPYYAPRRHPPYDASLISQI